MPSQAHYDPALFSGTHEYYARHRPGIPKELVNTIAGHFALKPDDRILDIGCGTGQAAMAFRGKCAEMVCIDPDPEMLKLARDKFRDTSVGATVSWLNNSAEDIGGKAGILGVFKIATFCRSFHWTDQESILRRLDNLISPDGGVAILSDGSLWTGHEDWQKSVKKVVQNYLGHERRAGKGAFKTTEEPWEAIIKRSPFRIVTTKNMAFERAWDIESIMGWLFSSSFASPALLGDKMDDFKREVATELLRLNPRGVFSERAVFNLILASRSNPENGSIR